MAKRQKRHKRKKPPKFEVNAAIQTWDIAKAGAAVSFEVKGADGGIIGRMEVGQGSLRWQPAYAKAKPIRVSWDQITDRLRRKSGK